MRIRSTTSLLLLCFNKSIFTRIALKSMSIYSKSVSIIRYLNILHNSNLISNYFFFNLQYLFFWFRQILVFISCKHSTKKNHFSLSLFYLLLYLTCLLKVILIINILWFEYILLNKISSMTHFWKYCDAD